MPRIIAIILELTVSLVILWLLTFIATFLHELGHAVGYMLATGDKDWHIRVGWGKRILHTKRLTVNLLVFDGVFIPSEAKLDTRKKLITILAGGPAVSLLLAAGLLVLRFSGLSFQSAIFADGAVEWFLNFALFTNLLILITSLIPGHYLWGKIKGLESDGLQIIRALKKHED